MTDEEREALKAKMAAKQREINNPGNEIQLLDIYAEPERMTVLEMFHRNIKRIILVGGMVAIMIAVVFDLMNVEFPTHDLKKIMSVVFIQMICI